MHLKENVCKVDVLHLKFTSLVTDWSNMFKILHHLWARGKKQSHLKNVSICDKWLHVKVLLLIWRAVVLYSVEVQDSCLSHFPEVLSASWWSPHSELATRGLRWCCSWLRCTLSAVNHTVQHVSLFCFVFYPISIFQFSRKKTAIYRQMFLIHLQKKNNKNNHKCFIQSRQWFCLSPWTSHGLSIWGGEKLGRWLWKTA